MALLRGINVGGKNKVAMARLQTSFETLGLKDVSTYINSGNILFSSDTSVTTLTDRIEAVIEKDFGFKIHVVLRDQENILHLAKAIPKTWMNGSDSKTDVLFLWEEYDRKEILGELTIKPGIDHVQYLPGAIVWHVDRANINKSGLLKIVGTPLYKRVTIRNINTVRKLAELLQH